MCRWDDSSRGQGLCEPEQTVCDGLLKLWWGGGWKRLNIFGSRLQVCDLVKGARICVFFLVLHGLAGVAVVGV